MGWIENIARTLFGEFLSFQRIWEMGMKVMMASWSEIRANRTIPI